MGLVKEIAAQQDESWDKTGNDDYMWSRPAMGALPGVLLTRHPERKPRELRRKWVKKSLELLDETERTRSAVSSD